MDLAVDHAGKDEAAAGIDSLAGRGQGACADGGDVAAAMAT